MNKSKRNLYAYAFACALLLGAAGTVSTFAQAASVAGTYRYKTYRPGGEGYDNTLEVEDKGGGRLRVTLSGAYIYKADGAETMHEGGGEGEATLRGNIATASLTPDGDDRPCRVLIIFEGREAGVKPGGDCNFNIEFGGTYVDEKRGAQRAAAGASGAGTPSVRYDKLEEFVNDSDRHRTGLRYVVTSVPAEKINKVTRAGAGRGGLFYLAADEDDGGAAAGFVTSAALVESLRASAEHEPVSLRVTATLVEFAGQFDVYRMSFVTRVEGLGEDGSVIWSAAGTEPARVRLRQ
jgi:hypothetical protein